MKIRVKKRDEMEKNPHCFLKMWKKIGLCFLKEENRWS